MDPSNPYQSSILIAESEDTRQQKLDSLRVAFLGWERLRVVYNLSLAALTTATVALLVLLRGYDWLHLGYLVEGAIAAILANIGFCLGLWLEAMLLFLGWRLATKRGVIFGIGLVFSSLITVLAILSTQMQF